MKGKREDKQNQTTHRIPFHILQEEILLSVLSKMDLGTFFNTRMSSKWLHSFIEENRDRIKIKHNIFRLSISHRGISYRGFFLKMSIRELTVLRPTDISLSRLKFSKIPRLMKVLYRLGWLADCRITLFELEEKYTLRIMDVIYENQFYCGNLIISHSRFAISDKVSLHPLLPKLNAVNLSGCPSPDLNFILGSETTISVVCYELMHTIIIKELVLAVSNGTSKVESFFIRYQLYRYDPIDEILAGIQYKLLWSEATHEQSVFTRRRLHPMNSRRDVRFLSVALTNGNIMGVCTGHTEHFNGIFAFILYNSEEELISALERGHTFRPR